MNKEINQLASAISQLYSSGSEEKSLDVINVMLSLMAKGLDLSVISGEVIKLLALPYPSLKKVLCTYLIRYSTSVSNLNILATNSLLLDFDDPNPYIRKLVIKTCCSVTCLHELAVELLPKALQDPSAYVRSTAASSCLLLINETNLDNNQDIIDTLYEMIKDSDSDVVVSSLLALNDILKKEGGIVINLRIAEYIMGRFSNFSEWDFVVICTILKKYTPASSNEALHYLQLLDSKLKDNDPIVFIPVTELTLHFISEYHKYLTKDVIEHLFKQIKFLLNTSNSDNLITLLEIISKYMLKHVDILLPYHKLFYCRFSDSSIVKVKKLDILSTLIVKDNNSEIMDEILLHCSNSTTEVSRQAVKSFITVLKSQSSSDVYIHTFLQLLDIRHNNLCEEIIIALSFLELDLKLNEKSIFQSVSRHFYNIISLDGKKALLRIIANYAEEIEESAYIVRELAKESYTFEDEIFSTQLLCTSMKLFLLRPAEMQLFLGQVLKSMKNSEIIFIRKQALIYYHLLKNLKHARKMVKLK